MKLVWCITILMVQNVVCDQIGDVYKHWKNARRERSCVTPNGKRGICLPPGSCGKYILNGNSNYVSKQCKEFNGVRTVCCSITRRWVHQRLVFLGSPYRSSVSSVVYVRDSLPSVSDPTAAGRYKRSDSNPSTNTSDTVSSSSSPSSASESTTTTEVPSTPTTEVPTTSSSPSSSEVKGDYAEALPLPPICGVSQGSFSRVVGGNNASLGDFPWIASIAYRVKGGYMFKCGGSLITAQHTLTAAHCIIGNEETLTFVRLGELDRNDHSQNRPVDALVKTIIAHEQYNPYNITNDIGLLVFVRKVIFTDFIRPICLPLSEELRKKDWVDYRPFVAGFGRTSFQGPQATHLQMLQLPVVSEESCKEAYSILKFLIIDKRNICAGGMEGKDACNGDSGGPLMQPVWNPVTLETFFYQTGVVSLGMKCGMKGFPGVYTRVTEFIPWIEKHVLGTESP